MKLQSLLAIEINYQYVKCFPEPTMNRWSKSEKKKIQIPMPKPLQIYNYHMVGVDLFDQTVATYRMQIRSRKWWWPFFA